MPLKLPPSIEVGAFLGGLVISDVPTIFEKLMIRSQVWITFKPAGLRIFGDARAEMVNLVY